MLRSVIDVGDAWMTLLPLMEVIMERLGCVGGVEEWLMIDRATTYD